MTARTLLFLSLVSIRLIVPATLTAADAPNRFSREIAPIFVKRCLECHSEREASGKLVLSDKTSLAKGGETGPAVVARSPEQSNLLTRVLSGEMPPPKRGHSQKLSDAEITALRDWIASGAEWPEGRKLDLYEATTEVRGGRDWWSLQPVKRPVIPNLTNLPKQELIHSPVDAFIQAQLNAAQMQPAPPADRATLIKRVSFDLLGLPPTFDEVQDFVADTAPDAYERLVDRLLASPHFGERWGRYWLDVVRYADTCGYERDQEKPFAWKFRDWVVQAINADISYDQFILDQLAGDEVAHRNEDSVIATGFLRLGTWNDEPNDADEYKYERLEDMVHVTSTAFLGLTVKCARCHDHKFDPIPQTDYYRMAAAFWPGAVDPRGRELLGGPTKDELGYDVMGWTDIRQPPPLRLLRKGEPKHPLEVVDPGHLSLIPAMHRPLEPAPLGAKTTHRRRQLAEWIASPVNPLTSRVLVNRLWMNHFGAGLVRSVDNFGYTGDKPTHPELLDWLASEITSHEGGASFTSLKRFHRLLVSSATFRQSSLHPQQEQYVTHDAGNRLWWHAERRRLDSESMRDRMLFVGDDLDTRMAGPGFKPTIQAEALEGLSRKDGAWKPSPVNEQRRRAVYMFSQRSLLPPLMTTFDFSDTTLPCVQRPVSTVAPQALALLNNSFAHERSTALAARILSEVPSASSNSKELWDRQIRRVWQIALSRDPSTGEATAAKAHLEAQAARFAKLKTGSPESEATLPTTGLALHLAAGTGVRIDRDGRVEDWQDQSGQQHHATQPIATQRPLLVKNAINSQPTLRLDGQRRFLHLAGQVVTSQSFAVFAVVTDRSTATAHREIFSNWNGSAGNAGTSLFLGMTGVDTTRLCDDFSGVGHVTDRQKPFLLSGVNAPNGVSIHQTGNELAARPQPIGPRNLKTNYVIGQQGNIDGEYWHGDIAELLVYDRELKDAERQAITKYLSRKYNLPNPQKPSTHGLRFDPQSPTFLALASLCHVLLNTNEFVYVD